MSRTQHDKLDELLVSVATLTERSKHVDKILVPLVKDTAKNTTGLAVVKTWGAIAALVVPLLITVGVNYTLK